MKKVLSTILALTLCASMLAGCGGNGGSSSSAADSSASESSASTSSTSSESSASESESSSEASAEGTSASGPITVVSREDGSGTRGAFVELIGVVDEEDNDMTTVDAEISNSTEVVIQSVAGNTGAIGYISLGSLDDTVKGVNIDGVEPTAENIENGSYTVSRPFNVATKGELTNEAAQDFMNYIMSEEGQAIVAEDYIPVSGVEPFESNGATGSVTVSGSSSVSPLMQKLIEGYNTVNPDVSIELQTNDSTTGMTNTIDGMCDIGMASRELKQEELDAGLVNTVIATDGIAIIVTNESPITDLTTEQVRDIYLGNITDWSEIG